MTRPSIATTSNAEPGTAFRAPRRWSSQRGSGAPLTYHPDPLSARNIPYRFSASRITRTSSGNPLVSKEAFRRTRIPIGGSVASGEAEVDGPGMHAMLPVELGGTPSTLIRARRGTQERRP